MIKDLDHILILGGDRRQRYLAQLLQEEGCCTALFDEEPPDDLAAEVARADAVLCPVPITRDGKTIIFSGSSGGQSPQTAANRTNIALDNQTLPDTSPPALPLDALLSCLSPGTLFFGGNLPAFVSAVCRERGILCFDYMALESAACQNALLTAEGAVGRAIALGPSAIRGSRCLVAGFGRCGRALSFLLQSMGAEAIPAVRDPASCPDALCLGLHPRSLQELPALLPRCEFVFNTIPAPVFDRKLLALLPREAALIDIASAPGGIDFEAAKELGLAAQLAPSLPGLTSPLSAARILRDAIVGCIRNNNLSE